MAGMTDAVDVIPSRSSLTCPLLPTLDTPRYKNVTFEAGGRLLSCGGYTSRGFDNTCISLERQAWVHHSRLTTEYRLHSAVAVIAGRKCIVGGLSKDDAIHTGVSGRQCVEEAE